MTNKPNKINTLQRNKSSDQPATQADNKSQKSKPNPTKDFGSRSGGMAKETKIGFALILVLVCGFGFVLYKKLDKDPQLMAQFKARFGLSSKEKEEDVLVGKKSDDKSASTDDAPSKLLGDETQTATPISDSHIKTAAAQEDFSDAFGDEFSSNDSKGNSQRNNSFNQQQQTNVAQKEPFDSGIDDEFSNLDNNTASQNKNTAQQSADSFDEFNFDDEETTTVSSQPQSTQQEPTFDDDFAQQPEVASKPQNTVDQTMIADNESFDDNTFTSDADTKSQVAKTETDTWDDDFTTQSDPISSQTSTTQDDPLGDWEEPAVTSKTENVDDFLDNSNSFDDNVASKSQTQVEPSTANNDVDDFLEKQTFEPVETVTSKNKTSANDTEFDDIGFDDSFTDTRQQSSSTASTSQTQIRSNSDQLVSKTLPRGKTSPGFYVVQSGDNYWKISQKVYRSSRYYQALDYYNRKQIPNPLALKPGMKIRIPNATTLESTYPQLFKNKTVAGSTTSVRPSEKENFSKDSGYFRNSAGRPYYRVGSRDTLSEIAHRHLGRQSRWRQIYELNRKQVPDPKSLKIGTVLVLPVDATQVRVVKRSTTLR